MKIPGLRAFVLAVGIIFIMLNVGCEKEQIPSEKKARVIAAENMQLKKQFQQYEKELEKQKGLLAKCQEEKKGLERNLGGEFDDQLNEIFKSLEEETGELRIENENLKLQIEKLKAEVKELQEKTTVKTRPLEQP